MKQSKKQSGRAKDVNISEVAKIALRALVKGQRQAARENARFGLPLLIWENGRIVEVPTQPAKDAVSRKTRNAAA